MKCEWCQNKIEILRQKLNLNTCYECAKYTTKIKQHKSKLSAMENINENELEENDAKAIASTRTT